MLPRPVWSQPIPPNLTSSASGTPHSGVPTRSSAGCRSRIRSPLCRQPERLQKQHIQNDGWDEYSNQRQDIRVLSRGVTRLRIYFCQRFVHRLCHYFRVTAVRLERVSTLRKRSQGRTILLRTTGRQISNYTFHVA
jgi:hypothetical protein